MSENDGVEVEAATSREEAEQMDAYIQDMDMVRTNIKLDQGILARNKQKHQGKLLPDYKGTIVVKFDVYAVHGWIKDGKYGKFLSLKLERTGVWAPPEEFTPQPEDPEIGF